MDTIVVGGGIVGLATARALIAKGHRPIVLEKESVIAAHQTGRNSGVIHSGIYYSPGSAKARLCREGRAELLSFCAEHDIRHEVCGKVIVATTGPEADRLTGLAERARHNGVAAELVGPAELADLEPNVAGLGALWVHDAGIVDFRSVCDAIVAEITRAGGEVRTGAMVSSIHRDGRDVVVETAAATLRGGALVNCAGLHADRVARRAGASPESRIVPFRGEYYELIAGRRDLVRNLVYPVPDPRFPFLGVHFTRMIGGGVHAGPNAVLALAREGYRWRDVNGRDLCEVLGYRGFWRLAARYWRTGSGEVWRSLHRGAFVAALRRLVPDVSRRDLERSPAGVRAQALRPSGELVDDFDLLTDGNTVHVLNAPSPAATASLAIGRTIANQIG